MINKPIRSFCNITDQSIAYRHIYKETKIRSIFIIFKRGDY